MIVPECSTARFFGCSYWASSEYIRPASANSLSSSAFCAILTIPSMGSQLSARSFSETGPGSVEWPTLMRTRLAALPFLRPPVFGNPLGLGTFQIVSIGILTQTVAESTIRPCVVTTENGASHRVTVFDVDPHRYQRSTLWRESGGCPTLQAKS